MKTFSAELLREKFVLHDPDAKPGQEGADVVALSNRFVVDLINHRDELIETYVVRAQNMHSTVRTAARIIQAFNQGGPIASRANPFDWDKAWDSIVNNYEFAYNPQRWVALYKDGKCIFSKGEYHPFLDVVEQCDIHNDKDYDYAIPMAEKLFSEAGKKVQIIHDSNVALNVVFENNQGRCGIILRGSNRTTTFNFSTKIKKSGETLNIAQCLGSAAAFLEGVQLAFLVGLNTIKIHMGIIPRFSKEEKQTREGGQRLARLRSEISNLESAFEVRYRPEKPEFHLLVTEAEELGLKTLTPPEDEDNVIADTDDDEDNSSDAPAE